MTNLQNEISKACEVLKIQYFLDYEVKLPSGALFKAEALIPSFGGLNGMLVISEYVKSTTQMLLELGYGFSVLEEPKSENENDLVSIVEMFTDWGYETDSRLKNDHY